MDKKSSRGKGLGERKGLHWNQNREVGALVQGEGKKITTANKSYLRQEKGVEKGNGSTRETKPQEPQKIELLEEGVGKSQEKPLFFTKVKVGILDKNVLRDSNIPSLVRV